MAELDMLKCRGCLCTNRKLVQVIDVVMKSCFSQILGEISFYTSTSSSDSELWLCWECHARMLNFLRFKRRVEECHRHFHLFNEKITLKTSDLSIDNHISLSYNPGQQQTEDDVFEVVKPNDLNIKQELINENQSLCGDNDDNDDGLSKIDDVLDEDDRLLIEFRNIKRDSQLEEVEKKKKILNGGKKRGRKKKIIAQNEEIRIYREIELDRNEIEKERRERETAEDYVNAMFKCEKCIVTFPNKDDKEDHENVKHLMHASKYVCEICHRSFATEVSYNYHTNRHRGRYECMVCMERFISKGAVERHHFQSHGSRIPVEEPNGDISQNGVIDTDEQQNGDASKAGTEEFPCEFCDKVFKWKTSLRKHSETHRIESGLKRRPYCEPCGLSFTTTANLQKHVRTSSKHQIQLKLRKLKESGEDVQKETVKLEVIAARAKHSCRHCGAAFQWRGNLKRHLLTHTARARGDLVCKPCNRTFSSIATFTQHMTASRRHVSENDFKYMCSDCGKKFANKTRLLDHVDWEHLKTYRHKCDQCSKIFRSDTSLKLHIQGVHRKENAERLCDYCGRGFPTLCKLRTHISAVHSSLAAFCCAECGARFSWHSCLSRHVRRVHRAGRDKDKT